MTGVCVCVCVCVGVCVLVCVCVSRYFCEVDVCKYRAAWCSTRMEGELLSYAANQQKILAFTLNNTTEIDISIYQRSNRSDYVCCLPSIIFDIYYY